MVDYVLAGQRITADLINQMGMVGQCVFKATRDTAQSIADSTVATTANALSWETVAVDDLDAWSSGSPTRFTPTRAGLYLCTGSVGFAGSASGSIRGCGWLINGTLADAATSRPHVGTIANAALTAEARSLPLELNGSTDYVELGAFQNTGGSLSTGTGTTRPFIAVYFVRPS